MNIVIHLLQGIRQDVHELRRRNRREIRELRRTTRRLEEAVDAINEERRRNRDEANEGLEMLLTADYSQVIGNFDGRKKILIKSKKTKYN